MRFWSAPDDGTFISKSTGPPLGIAALDMPTTPQRLWATIQRGKHR
jgi:hypothetical protein